MASSQKIRASRKFLTKLKTTNPELYNEIVSQAQWLINSDKQDMKPKEIKKSLRYKLANNPEFDPRQGEDSYVIKAAIDALAPDKAVANGAKRLYGSSLDAIFKNSFGEVLQFFIDEGLFTDVFATSKNQNAKNAKKDFMDQKNAYNPVSIKDTENNFVDVISLKSK